MYTFDLIEALVYKIPDLKKVFVELDIVNEERTISSNQHKEFSNLLKPFNRPVVIDVIGKTEFLVLIEPGIKGKTYDVIEIDGYNSTITKLSKGGLISLLRDKINTRDFLPDPLIRKIIYINDYTNFVDGFIFSEIDRTTWTFDLNPLSLNLKSIKKASVTNILIEILNDFQGET